jgi:hypothetical protein
MSQFIWWLTQNFSLDLNMKLWRLFRNFNRRNVHVHEDLSREQTFSSSGDNGQNIPRKFTLSYKEVDANHDLRQCPKSKSWKNNSMASPTSFRGLASVKKKVDAKPPIIMPPVLRASKVEMYQHHGRILIASLCFVLFFFFLSYSGIRSFDVFVR